MMCHMKQRLIALCCWLAGVAIWPALALAKDEETLLDARVDGYAKTVKVPEASSTLLWAILLVLTAICIAALFKDAKRSHLD